MDLQRGRPIGFRRCGARVLKTHFFAPPNLDGFTGVCVRVSDRERTSERERERERECVYERECVCVCLILSVCSLLVGSSGSSRPIGTIITSFPKNNGTPRQGAIVPASKARLQLELAIMLRAVSKESSWWHPARIQVGCPLPSGISTAIQDLPRQICCCPLSIPHAHAYPDP